MIDYMNLNFRLSSDKNGKSSYVISRFRGRGTTWQSSRLLRNKSINDDFRLKFETLLAADGATSLTVELHFLGAEEWALSPVAVMGYAASAVFWFAMALRSRLFSGSCTVRRAIDCVVCGAANVYCGGLNSAGGQLRTLRSCETTHQHEGSIKCRTLASNVQPTRVAELTLRSLFKTL